MCVGGGGIVLYNEFVGYVFRGGQLYQPVNFMANVFKLLYYSNYCIIQITVLSGRNVSIIR